MHIKNSSYSNPLKPVPTPTVMREQHQEKCFMPSNQKSAPFSSRWPLILILLIVGTFLVYIVQHKKASRLSEESPAAQPTPPTATAKAPAVNTTDPDLGVFYPSQGHDHWEMSQLRGFHYNSSPPTSGPHREEFIGSYFPDSPMPDYIQVHLLEHGNILIQYNCTCPDTVSKLQSIARSFDTYAPSIGLEEGKGVVVAKNPTIPSLITVTAWTRLLTLNKADSDKIRKFITQWLGNSQNSRQ